MGSESEQGTAEARQQIVVVALAAALGVLVYFHPLPHISEEGRRRASRNAEMVTCG